MFIAIRFVNAMALEMIKLSAVGVAALSAFGQNTQAAESPAIRVRVMHQRSAMNLTGAGIEFPGAQQVQAGLRRLVIIRGATENQHDGVHFKWSIIDRDQNKLLSEVTAPVIELRGDWLRSTLKPLPNEISLYGAQDTAEFDVIARLDLETYVAGVLPSEMPVKWPREALKAQAIAARTYALFKRAQRATATFDVEATVLDQIFSAATLDEERRARVAMAVGDTKGKIVVDKSGQPFATYFHSDCGGHTEEAQEVWGGRKPANSLNGEAEQNINTTVDASCPMSRAARWNTQISKELLSNRFNAPPTANRTVKALGIENLTKSGRIAQLRISWSDGSSQTVSGQVFRERLGFSRVKSTNFSIKSNKNGFELQGVGHGHGVGMCQWGARQLAKAGRNYREILSHYYPQAQLSGLNNSGLNSSSLSNGRFTGAAQTPTFEN